MREKTGFLFDVDNTLLDNDRVTFDLRDHLDAEVGHERQERYPEPSTKPPRLVESLDILI